MKVLRVSFLFLAALLSAAFAQNGSGAATPRASYNTAIFVTNRAGAEYDAQIPVLEDLLTAKLTDVGFSLMTRGVVIEAASKFDNSLASQDRPDDRLSAQLQDQSSALRLAESMGADYILSASIAGITKQKRNINAYGVQVANYEYTLRLAYNVFDANGGGSLTGGVVRATKTEQNTIHSNQGFKVVPPDPSTPAAPPGSEAANADEALARFAKQYEKAIGLVVIAAPNGPVPMATAWGVGPNAFATNSHVTEPVKEYMAKGLPVYVIINKHPDLRYPVKRAISHPHYGGPGPNADGRQPAVGGYDVGVLEVEGALQSWMPVATMDELKQLDSGHRIAYLGFPMEEIQGGGVDPRSPVATMQSGIVTANTDWWLSHGTPETRQLVQHNLSSSGGASGSPIFNSKGRVIALHSAGNSSQSVAIEDGQMKVTRRKSGVQINYAQRADLLADVYTLRTSGSGSSSVAAKAPVAVAFVDPDIEAVVADLLDDATTQLATMLKAKVAQNRIPAPSAKANFVNITLNVETADLYVPDVRIGPENTVTIQDGRLAVAPLNVSVEIDGVTVGSAPGKIQVRPGLRKLRLTREGYTPWERTINAVEGQTLTIAMQMSPTGLARWQELTAFMNALKNGAKLTDAQVQVLQGQAQMLQNSGFKVNVNTTDGIVIQNRSIFGL
jgi:V8-like Glu-specific endopeptidase